ncbi:MAG: uncharacterized protein KVP18_000392 [Porospora cf. gigantea A]|nr:MAG: hypothetical protein KVP18_000392 [Porospora cf. gigantea A]
MVSRTVHPKLYCYPPFLSYIVKVNNILDNQSMTDFSKRAASDATFCRTEEEVSEAAAKLLRRLQLLNLLTGDECGAELISNLADLVRKDCDDDDDEEEFVPQSEGCGWGEQNADLIPELLKRVSPQEPLNTTKKRKRKEIEHPAGDPPTAPDQDTVRVHVLHASLSMPI